MLKITDDIIGTQRLPVLACDIPAGNSRCACGERMAGFFTEDKVQVVLDPDAGLEGDRRQHKVRIRASALFSEADLEQLLEHEAYIHTATLLNGKHQPAALAGVGAPRTTRTQEGWRPSPRIVTGAMDIARLRRIALRVIMVRDALAGADFIECSRASSRPARPRWRATAAPPASSAAATVRGGVCFTKDGAYLEGVFSIQLFIRKALQEGRGTCCRCCSSAASPPATCSRWSPSSPRA
jgi:hypothetical protein